MKQITEEQYRERIAAVIKEMEDAIKDIDYNMDPEGETIMEFKADPMVEIGFQADPETKKKLTNMIYLHIGIPGYFGDPDFDPTTDLEVNASIFQEVIWDNRFKFLELLEDMAWVIFTENTNNDPCAFIYSVDTDHLGYYVEFTVEVTDYFS